VLLQEGGKMKKDQSMKAFFERPDRYADAINGFGCGGKQLVTAKDLHEVDSKVFQSQKHRDIARKVAFGVNFAIIGIEAQETIDYLIALRNMLYDAGMYQKQAALIQKDAEKRKGWTKGEYLYRFGKEDKLQPVVTFILYTGEETYDGPESLHDIIDFADVPLEICQLVSNYDIHVIRVRDLKNTDMFQTDLKYVLDFLRFSKDRKALKEYIENEPYFQHVDADVFRVLDNYANLKRLNIQEEDYEGGIDMCTAIREMLEESELKGLTEGRAEGRAEGKMEGFIIALNTLHLSSSATIEKLCENFDLTPEEAAKEVKKYIN